MNIERLLKTVQTEHNNWITFADGTGTTIDYYKDWLLMQYCMDIRKMNYYSQVLADTTGEATMEREMMLWYSKTELRCYEKNEV